MQLLELLAPMLVENRPLLQAVQVLAPVVLLEYRPAPQAMQLVELLAPVLLENCPTPQAMQASVLPAADMVGW